MSEPQPDLTESRRATSVLKDLRSTAGRWLGVGMALPLIGGVLLIGQAFLLAEVLGETIQGGKSLDDVTPMIAAIGTLWVARALLAALTEQAGTIGAEKLKMALRTQLFDHLLTQKSRLTAASASGAVAAALADQTEALEPYFARYLPAMVGATILPLAFAVVLVPFDWIVALLFLVTAPLIPLFMALTGIGAQAATDRQAAALARLSGYFADRLRGLLTLKLFGQTDAAIREVHEASEQLRKRTNRVLAIAFLSSSILEFFAALGVAGVALYVGLTFLGLLPVNPGLTLSAGMFALLMAPEVYQPLRQLAAHYHDRAAARSAIAEIERHIARLDALQSVPPTNMMRVARQPGHLIISGLTLGSGRNAPILNKLDLVIRGGESLAIMGQSGVGKTTLARAIGQLLLYQGKIVLDKQDVAALPDHMRRQRLAVLSQKPWIFQGSIGDNIAFARPDVCAAEISNAAHLAGIEDFAGAIPQGLETRIGEGGLGLSGGQAQRVALARLFLTDPDLIIADEPTAHLDVATEARMLDALFKFATGRTLILITHSATVATRADRTMRLAAGKLLDVPVAFPRQLSVKERVA